MKNNSYICGVFAKGIILIAVAGISFSTTGKHRNYGLPISCDFCTATVGNVFGETEVVQPFLHTYNYNFSFAMPKTARNCTDTQGVSIATCNPTKTGLIPSTTNQFVSLLHDLCAAKLSIDAFYEAQTEGLMFDCPENYLRAETYLCDAIWALSDYVGMFTTEHLLTRKNG